MELGMSDIRRPLSPERPNPHGIGSQPDNAVPAGQTGPVVGDGDRRARGGGARRPGPVRRVLTRTVAGAWKDDVFSESASAAFWQTLSLPPLLLGIFGILGYVGDWFGPDTVAAVQQWIVGATGEVFSRNAVEEIIAPTVGDILTTAPGAVVSVGFVLSLWSGSSAMAAFVDAICKAHRQFELRGYLWQRVLAILLYLVALVFVIVGLPVVAIGPERLLALVPPSFAPELQAVSTWLITPVVGLVLLLALTTLYRIALPHKPPWYRGLPGAVLAGAVFTVSVTSLRAYLDWVTSTGYTYGALAAPIAFLLGTFFIAMSIVLGAHLNAAIQAEWPAPLRRRGSAIGSSTESAEGDGGTGDAAGRSDRDPEDRDPEDQDPEDQDHAPPDMAADRVR